MAISTIQSNGVESERRVLIVGAGPVGLFTAIKLARAGISSTVIEKESSTSAAPRACGYFGATLHAMNEVGVFQKALKKGYMAGALCWTSLPIDDGKGGKRNGDVVAVQPLAGHHDDLTTPNSGCLVLPQSELTKMLYADALQTGKVDVLFNRDLQAIEDDGEQVTAVLQDTQNPSSTQHVRGSFLVGADGGRSRTRKLLNIHLPGHTWPERFVATDVEIICGDIAAKYPIQYAFAPTHYAVIVALTPPVPGEKALWRYGIAHDANDPRTDEELLTDEHINNLYEEVMEGSRPLQYKIQRRSIYYVHQRLATTMRRGRSLLAGDAAHLNNPIGGMGLNTGLLDADALAEALIMIINEHQPLSLLDVYSDERRKVFQTMVDPMTTQNKIRLQYNTAEKAAKDDWYFRTLQNLTPEVGHEMAKPFSEVWRTNMRQFGRQV